MNVCKCASVQVCKCAGVRQAERAGRQAADVRMEAQRAKTPASAGGRVHDSRPRQGHARPMCFL
jgi:hypothetical protein